MLKDRLYEKRKLTGEDEKEIVSLVKKKIKNDNYFVKGNFLNRDYFKDKLYVLLKDEIYLRVEKKKNNTGKTVDQRIPFLNTELYDGSRCSIIIPPVSDRVYVSIRVFNCIDFELEDLLKLNMFTKKHYDILKDLISKKKNILIPGSMGSGKTTLLNTL